MLFVLALPGRAADMVTTNAAVAAAQEGQPEGLPAKATTVFSIGPLPVTGSCW